MHRDNHILKVSLLLQRSAVAAPEFYFTRECEKFGALMPSLPQIFVLSLATPSFLIPLFVSPGTKNKMQTGYHHKILLNK